MSFRAVQFCILARMTKIDALQHAMALVFSATSLPCCYFSLVFIVSRPAKVLCNPLSLSEIMYAILAREFSLRGARTSMLVPIRTLCRLAFNVHVRPPPDDFSSFSFFAFYSFLLIRSLNQVVLLCTTLSLSPSLHPLLSLFPSFFLCPPTVLRPFHTRRSRCPLDAQSEEQHQYAKLKVLLLQSSGLRKQLEATFRKFLPVFLYQAFLVVRSTWRHQIQQSDTDTNIEIQEESLPALGSSLEILDVT